MSNHDSKNSAPSLQSRLKELDELVDWFSSEDFNLDQALEKYQKAIESAQSIQSDLNSLQNQVEIIHENFTK